MKDFDTRLRDAAADGVRFSERRHRRVMDHLDDTPAVAAAPPPPSTRRTLAIAAAAAVAIGVALWQHAAPPPAPPRQLASAPSDAGPAARLPDTVAVPEGVRHYSQFFLDQLDRACSIGRRAT